MTSLFSRLLPPAVVRVLRLGGAAAVLAALTACAHQATPYDYTAFRRRSRPRC